MFQEHLKQLFHNKTARNGSVFTFFAFANNGISFILLLILANFIAPEGYGHLNLYNTFVQLFTYVVPLGCTGFISVSFFKKSHTELGMIINTVLIISLSLTFLSSLLSLLTPSLGTIVGLGSYYQLLAFAVCLCLVVYNMSLDLFRLEERPVVYGVISLSFCLLNFMLSMYLVVGRSLDWQGRVYAQIIVAVVFALIGFYFFVQRGYFCWIKPSLSIVKETLIFGTPLIPHQVAFWVRQSMDRIIINYFLGVEMVGLYGFAFNFANIVTIVGTAFNAAFSVYQFKQLATNDAIRVKKMVKIGRYMVAFYILITIVISLICTILIPFIVPQYADSAKYIFPLCLSAMFICFYMVYVNYLFYYEKTRHLMYITVSISLLQLIMSLLLTRYGAIWTAYISTLISFLIFISVYLYGTKLLKTYFCYK